MKFLDTFQDIKSAPEGQFSRSPKDGSQTWDLSPPASPEH